MGLWVTYKSALEIKDIALMDNIAFHIVFYLELCVIGFKTKQKHENLCGNQSSKICQPVC